MQPRRESSDANDAGHILLVDDEPDIGTLVQDYLSGAGYQVSVAQNGREMRQIIESCVVDSVLLDIGLPGEDGLTLALSLRAERPNIAIIILTGRGDPIDRIIGLEMGADDYVTKPFHMRELLARIKSIRRRERRPPATAPACTRARFAGWLLDMSARELLTPGGVSVRLTRGEFDLLTAFVTHPNQVLSRERLLDLVRGRAIGPFDRTIDVQIGRLRRKLNDTAQDRQLIKTVRRGGYIFTAPVDAIPAAPALAPARSAAA